MKKVKENIAEHHNTITEKNNTKFFSIHQTVEIPVNRKLHLDLEIPYEIPSGKARVEFKVISFGKKERKLAPKVQTAATPHTDALLSLLSNIGEVNIGEIRDERLAKEL